MADIRILGNRNGNNPNGKFQPSIMQRTFLSRPHRVVFVGHIARALDQNNDAALGRKQLDQLVHIETTALSEIDAQPSDLDNISSTRRKMLELLSATHRQDYADYLTCMGIGYFNCGEYQNAINVFNALLMGPSICDTAQVRCELASACGRLAEQWLLDSQDMINDATALLDTALGHMRTARGKEFIGLDQVEIFEFELFERRLTAEALILKDKDAGLEYACDKMIVERMEGDEGAIYGAIDSVSALLAKVLNPQSKKNPIKGALGSEIAADYNLALSYERLKNRIATAVGYKYQRDKFIISLYEINMLILEKKVLDPKPFVSAIQEVIGENDGLDIQLEIIYMDCLSRLPQAVREHIFAGILISGAESAAEITLKWIAANLPYDEIAQVIIKSNEANSSLGKRLAARLLHEYIDFMVENRSDEPKLKEKLQALLKDAKGKGKELFFQPVVVQAEINLRAKSKLLRGEKKRLEAAKKSEALEAKKEARLNELMSGTKFVSLKDYQELITLLKEQGNLQAGLDLMKQLADPEPVLLLADALWQADATLWPQLCRYFSELFADQQVNKRTVEYLRAQWESLSATADNLVASDTKKISNDKTTVMQSYFDSLLRVNPSIKTIEFPRSERAFDFVFVNLRGLIVVGQMAAQITSLPYRTPVSFMSCWKAIFSRKLKKLEAVLPAAQHNRLKRARIALFHEALAIDPNNITAAFELANIYIIDTLADEAGQYLEKIRLDPEDVAAKVRLFAMENNVALLKIYQLLSQGKKEKAMAVYLANMEKYRQQRIKEELQADPNDQYLSRQKHFIEVNLGFLHLNIGNYREARASFEALLVNEPYDPNLILGYVLSFVFEGKINEVLGFLEQALSRATAKGGLGPTDSKLFQLYQIYADMLDLVGHTSLASEYCFEGGTGLLARMKSCRFSILEGKLDEAEKKLEEIEVLLKNAQAGEMKKHQSFYFLVRAEYLHKRLLEGQGTKQQVEEELFLAIESFSRMPGVPYLELFSRFVLARIYAEWGFRKNEKDAKHYFMLSLKVYEEILERWPKFTLARQKLIAVLMTDPFENHAAIIGQLEQLVALEQVHGFNDKVLYFLLIKMSVAKDNEEARLLDELEKNSSQFANILEKALCRICQGMNAEKLIGRLIEPLGNKLVAHNILSADEQKDIKAAMKKLLKKAPGLDEWTPKYHFPKLMDVAKQLVVNSDFGRAYIALRDSENDKDYEKAYAGFYAFYLKHPDSDVSRDLAGVLFNWANYLESQKQFGTAVEKLKQALQFDPESSKIKGFLAKLLVNLLRYDEALPFAQAAYKAEPDNVMNLNTLGYIYLLKYHEKYERPLLQKARQLIEKALEIDPTLVHPWLNMGLILVEYGEYTRAFECYKNYIQNQNAFFPFLQFVSAIVSKQDWEKGLEAGDLIRFLHDSITQIDLNSMSLPQCAQLINVLSILHDSGYEEAASVVETFLANNAIYKQAVRQADEE